MAKVASATDVESLAKFAIAHIGFADGLASRGHATRTSTVRTRRSHCIARKEMRRFAGAQIRQLHRFRRCPPPLPEIPPLWKRLRVPRRARTAYRGDRATTGRGFAGGRGTWRKTGRAAKGPHRRSRPRRRPAPRQRLRPRRRTRQPQRRVAVCHPLERRRGARAPAACRASPAQPSMHRKCQLPRRRSPRWQLRQRPQRHRQYPLLTTRPGSKCRTDRSRPARPQRTSVRPPTAWRQRLRHPPPSRRATPRP